MTVSTAVTVTVSTAVTVTVSTAVTVTVSTAVTASWRGSRQFSRIPLQIKHLAHKGELIEVLRSKVREVRINAP